MKKSARRSIVLLPPDGGTARAFPVRGFVVFALAFVLAVGFAGYFIPYSRFSLHKVKLYERNNLRNVNQDLLVRIVGVRRILGELQGEVGQLTAKQDELANTGERPRYLRPVVRPVAVTAGVLELDGLVSGYESIVSRLQARIDSVPSFLDKVPLTLPIGGRPQISALFGSRLDPFTGVIKAHNGIDFVSPRGTPVFSAADGTVAEVRNDSRRWGLLVRIRHEFGFATVYAHLGSTNVRYGMRVKRGQEIGTVGATGLTTGPHLHYELHHGDLPIDPRRVLFPSYEPLFSPGVNSLTDESVVDLQ